MFSIDHSTGAITMHRGDTGSFKLHASRKSGDAWTEDDRMIFTVKNGAGDTVMQRFYRLDDQYDLGDGVVLIEFHNDDTDTWDNGTYFTEWRYVINPVWEGTAPTSRCADAMTANARIVEGDIVRVPEGGQSTMTLANIYGEV